jgi:hypothetical protein
MAVSDRRRSFFSGDFHPTGTEYADEDVHSDIVLVGRSCSEMVIHLQCINAGTEDS